MKVVEEEFEEREVSLWRDVSPRPLSRESPHMEQSATVGIDVGALNESEFRRFGLVLDVDGKVDDAGSGEDDDESEAVEAFAVET